MQALADRETAVREGRLATIVFIRARNSRGQETSAFVDYGERLRAGGMDAFFAGLQLEPAPEDLSYYNWTTRTARIKNSSTFEVCLRKTLAVLLSRGSWCYQRMHCPPENDVEYQVWSVFTCAADQRARQPWSCL